MKTDLILKIKFEEDYIVKNEKIYKPDFVLPKKCLLFIYVLHCCNT
ncbi:protein of unknown function [Chryseobacterium sp. JV274]|nr:protein of unknown function [Chryseobacterium sp. JV274]